MKLIGRRRESDVSKALSKLVLLPTLRGEGGRRPDEGRTAGTSSVARRESIVALIEGYFHTAGLKATLNKSILALFSGRMREPSARLLSPNQSLM